MKLRDYDKDQRSNTKIAKFFHQKCHLFQLLNMPASNKVSSDFLWRGPIWKNLKVINIYAKITKRNYHMCQSEITNFSQTPSLDLWRGGFCQHTACDGHTDVNSDNSIYTIWMVWSQGKLYQTIFISWLSCSNKIAHF